MRHGPAAKLILALIVTCLPAAADHPRAQHLGSVRWQIDSPWFGGFSGIDMSRDGTHMTVVSDTAILLRARLERRDGAITAIVADKPVHLKSAVGKKLRGKFADSEGLAIARDGTIHVSFEGVARVARYDRPDSRAEVLPRPAAFRQLPHNGALEALAIDAAGHLYTLPESGRDRDGAIPVFRWNGRAWSVPFTLPPRGRFLPVGADFGPDGRLYVLERAFNPPFGFRARLRRWTITPRGPTNEETLLQTATGTHDNLEGVAIWRDDAGRLRATMVSDDNFFALQRTELVEYALPD